MRTLLPLLLLLFPFSIHAAPTNACLEIFKNLSTSSTIDISEDLPRKAVSQLITDVYSLTGGPQALGPHNPVQVLTYKGNDLVLAIDAKLAHSMGPVAFAEQHLGISPNTQNQAWFKKFEDRFKDYLSEEFETRGLASLWFDIEAVKTVDRILFMRFFDSHLENGTDQAYVGPDKDARIALVTLKIPDTDQSVLPFTAYTEPKINKPTFVPRTILKPENIIKQLPPENGRARYITTVPGFKFHNGANRTAKLIDGITENRGTYLYNMTKKSNVTVIHVATWVYAYELQFIETAAFQEIRFMSVTQLTNIEEANLTTEIVKQDLLNPSNLVGVYGAHTANPVNVYLPQILPKIVNREEIRNTQFDLTTLAAESQIPNLADKLSALAIDSTFAINVKRTDRYVTDQKTGNKVFVSIHIPRTIMFYKAADGKVYITSYQKTYAPFEN